MLWYSAQLTRESTGQLECQHHNKKYKRDSLRDFFPLIETISNVVPWRDLQGISVTIMAQLNKDEFQNHQAQTRELTSTQYVILADSQRKKRALAETRLKYNSLVDENKRLLLDRNESERQTFEVCNSVISYERWFSVELFLNLAIGWLVMLRADGWWKVLRVREVHVLVSGRRAQHHAAKKRTVNLQPTYILKIILMRSYSYAVLP